MSAHATATILPLGPKAHLRLSVQVMGQPASLTIRPPRDGIPDRR